MARKRLGEILVEAGALTEPQLAQALAQQQQVGGRLGQILVQYGFVTERQMVMSLSRQHGLPAARFPDEVSPALLKTVPLEVCERHGVFPLSVMKDSKGEILTLAMVDPTNIEIIDAIQFRTRRRVIPTVAGEVETQTAIRRHYHGEKPRPVVASEPAQFAGEEIDLGSDLGGDDIPLVTGRIVTGDPVSPVGPQTAHNLPAHAPPAHAPVQAAPAELTPPEPDVPFATGAADSLFGARGGLLGSDDEDDVTRPSQPLPLIAGAASAPSMSAVNAAFEAAAALPAPAPFGGTAPFAPAPALVAPFTPADTQPGALEPVSLDPSFLEPLDPTPDEVAQRTEVTPRFTFDAVDTAPLGEPLELVSVETAPVDGAPLELAPIELDLASAPVDSAPIDAAPVEAASIELELAPIELDLANPRVESAPIDAAPVEAAPIELELAPIELELAPVEPAAPVEAAPIELELAPIELDPAPVAAIEAAPIELEQAPVDLDETETAPAAPAPRGPALITGVQPVLQAAAQLPVQPAVPGVPPAAMQDVPQALRDAPFCPDCGADRVAGAKFCPICGRSFTGAARAKGALPTQPPATVPALHVPRIDPTPKASNSPISLEGLAVLEGIRGPELRPRTSFAGSPDEPRALLGQPQNGVGLMVTHLTPTHRADGSVPDERALLAGEGPEKLPAHLVAARRDERASAWALCDEVDVIAASAPSIASSPPSLSPAPSIAAPPAAPAANGSLAESWRDAAETQLPRLDNRANVAAVPRARETFMPSPDDAMPPPAALVEPQIAYTPAAVAAASASSAPPWAAFARTTAPATPVAPAPPAAAAPAPTPSLVMTLDPVELRKLAERLVQKGAITPEDLEAAKKSEK